MDNQVDEITSQITAQKKEWNDLLSRLTELQLNMIPFEGSWTAGQVAEHIRLSDAGLLRLLNGTSKDTERNVMEKSDKIKSLFLNFGRKLNAPDFIIPANINYKTEELVTAVNAGKDALIDAAGTLDLSRTRTDFPAALIGEYTGWEIYLFIITHNTRHLHQLHTISEAVIKSDHPAIHH